jgi:hypothetical protein
MKTPKEKAEELVDKYYWIFGDGYLGKQHIQCALIAVDVILIDCGAKDWSGDEACEGKNYWQEVKKEIELS